MRTTRRKQPSADPTKLHSGTVRRGANGEWWLQKRGAWNPIKRSTAKRPKKASAAQIAWAKKHGMIKVFYNNPESCNCRTTKRKTCLRMPAPMEGWYMSNKLRPNSAANPYSHVDEYIGPVETLHTMHRLMEAQFKTYKKMGLVVDYDFQVKTMMEKYKSWTRV